MKRFLLLNESFMFNLQSVSHVEDNTSLAMFSFYVSLFVSYTWKRVHQMSKSEWRCSGGVFCWIFCWAADCRVEQSVQNIRINAGLMPGTNIPTDACCTLKDVQTNLKHFKNRTIASTIQYKVKVCE